MPQLQKKVEPAGVKMSVPPPPSPQSSKRMVYIIAAVVVVVVVAGLAYFLLGKSNEPAQQEQVVSKLPKVWLNQYFQQEICEDQSKCGDAANPDSDGLNNYDEFKAGTVPNDPDSDKDGLADGDEVNIYKTEPTLKYTDRREIVSQNDWTDGFQIKNGYDPLTPGLPFTESRNQQIATDTAALGLHEPTITTLSQ
ncbi:MAG: hypothetical protein A3B95_03915 [Candidatus Doudnabacteria bacterium RIFCSPHIGHO2_02_FULL_43_13b]|nr:MAG: hypothetical protein A3B95_03915 [Candidatus Doudnabacteria bacterium RIFCSPHIGHO2_02_FULL_43_13b]